MSLTRPVSLGRLTCHPERSEGFMHLGYSSPLRNFFASFSRSTRIALLCAAVFAFSGATDPAAHFNEVGHQLMCICGCAQVLLECNHVGCPSSDGMRGELLTAVGRGDSDSLIEQSFMQKYGPTVLAAPPNTGFNRTVWLMPFFLLFTGFALVAWLVRLWKDRPAPALADGIHPASGGDLDRFRDQASRETDL